ncbi:hypothetical protein ANN_00434 [Periplaneta americana]|uniref:Uncharacterized protein n=1 Tax=Periplaneta americana TaxID=6978 RepID=A0ABQ8TUT5_PERAM|nr:hypothetical protein ANN_00434 [Periplaneta americana]
MGESRNAYRVLVGRPEGKRPLGRPRRGWEDNIKVDLREVGYDDRDWINLAQDRDRWRAYMRAAMNLRRLPPNYTVEDLERAVRDVKNSNYSYRGAQERYSIIFPHMSTLKGRKVPVTKIGVGRSIALSSETEQKCSVSDSPCENWCLQLPPFKSLLSKNLKVRIYKTVILSVVLYGCGTWTLTLREEQELRVFENKVLRKIFGAKRDEVTGEWRKLHNTELHALYSSSPDIIRNIKSRRLRWAGHVARIGESRNAYRVLFGRPEGKRPLGRPRRRWEDNIKMDFREVGYDDRDWINVAQDRDRWRAYVRAAMNLRVP